MRKQFLIDRQTNEVTVYMIDTQEFKHPVMKFTQDSDLIPLIAKALQFCYDVGFFDASKDSFNQIEDLKYMTTQIKESIKKPQGISF